MRIWILALCLLCSGASTGAFIFYNKWQHAVRDVHTIVADPKALKAKLEAGAPEWMVSQIREDLKPYAASGITKNMVDAAFAGERIKDFGLIRFTIQDGHITFAHDEQHLYSRHFRQMLGFFKQLGQCVKLPDVDFVISMADGFTGNPGLGPCFVFAKNRDEGSLILVPDINAMTGHDRTRKLVFAAREKYPWNKKVAKGFWRGSTTGGYSRADTWQELDRAKLVLVSLAYPGLVDARFHQVVQCDKSVPQLLKEKGMVSKAVSKGDHLKYKYLVDVDGNSCSFERYFWLLLSNSLVIKQVSPNVQWYYGALQPYEHFLPVKKDLSDLVEKIEWAKTHDEECRIMSERASAFIQNNLTPEDTLLYMYHLLREYASLYRR